jgi:hypothetical protein
LEKGSSPFYSVLNTTFYALQELSWQIDKKEKKIFLIYKVIQKGGVAKSNLYD